MAGFPRSSPPPTRPHKFTMRVRTPASRISEVEECDTQTFGGKSAFRRESSGLKTRFSVAALPVSAPSEDIWARDIHSQQESVIPQSSETARPVSIRNSATPTGGSGRGMQIGDGKSEIRNPKSEIRNPKSEIPSGGRRLEEPNSCVIMRGPVEVVWWTGHARVWTTRRWDSCFRR